MEQESIQRLRRLLRESSAVIPETRPQPYSIRPEEFEKAREEEIRKFNEWRKAHPEVK